MLLSDMIVYTWTTFMLQKVCHISSMPYLSSVFISLWLYDKVFQCYITGADPHMVRIGTGPPFWQINHANSAYFRLFLGYFRVISATRPPLLDLGLPFLHILDPPLYHGSTTLGLVAQSRIFLWKYKHCYTIIPGKSILARSFITLHTSRFFFLLMLEYLHDA